MGFPHVALRAGRTHCWSFASVQHPKVNTCAVGGTCHDAAHCIDFLHQMSLTDSTDRRVAGHLADCFDVVREQQRFATHARRGSGCLGAGVTAANDDHIVGFWIKHG